MRTKINRKQARNLTPAERTRCARLTLGTAGSMKYQLATCSNEARAGEDDLSYAYLLKDETGKILAWALAFDAGRDGTSVYYYVAPSQRRQGYGSRLHKTVTRHHRAYVYPHDHGSREFFKAHAGTYACDEDDLECMYCGQDCGRDCE